MKATRRQETLKWGSHKSRDTGTTRSWRRQGEPPLEPSEGSWPCGHLELGPLAFRSGRENISVVSATQFGEICYDSPGN